MWRFICGFSSGVYVGTFYNCRPCMKTVEKFIREYIPKEKDKKDEQDKK
jgi:hypothetical protein|tara:strand:- start:981 stop:1127 length:147 start_codon:yes stop_codon:yes gene_type:complete